MEYNTRQAVSSKLKKFDYLSKEEDIIEVTEWSNGEGWDIYISDTLLQLTRGQLEAINFLTQAIDFKEK